MAARIDSLRGLGAWQALARHADEVRDLHLRDLFAEDRHRGERFAVEAEGIYLDYSKNRVTGQTLRLLVRLAKKRGLRERIDEMFAGEAINSTEDRAALHVALRVPVGSRLEAGGVDIGADVQNALKRMSLFAEGIRAGDWKGATGKPVRNVINIGIGGSDLGPVMATRRSATTAG